MVAHNCHGKTKNLMAKTKYLTAKPKTSRQKQKPHGKTKNLTAKTKYLTTKPKTSRQNQILHSKNQIPVPHSKSKYPRQNKAILLLLWGILFLPWGFLFCLDVFVFAMKFLVLPWQLWATIDHYQTCKSHESHDCRTCLTLSRVGNWLLTLSQKSQTPKNFVVVGFISKLDINRQPAKPKESA